MKNKNFTIKTMNQEEVKITVEWAANEGWNPGLHDAENYFTADPNGFFIGYLDDEPIATISAVKYENDFGFLGFYIVKPEYRGQGYGIQIWTAALEYLKGCNVGLDGVVAQQENYKKSSFQMAYQNIRYEGVGGGDAPENSDIIELSSLPFESIENYHKPFFPAKRAAFLQTWVNQPDSFSLAIINYGKLGGIGTIRKCQNGYKIAPLFADTHTLAESLFLALRAKVTSSDPIFLDVPQLNKSAIALAEKYGMSVSFETARMYTKEAPSMPLDRTFGITSFEIG